MNAASQRSVHPPVHGSVQESLQGSTPFLRIALPLLGAAIFVLYGAVVLAHPLPPALGDFADWVYQGVLLARHIHHLPDLSHTLKHYPVPNSTVTVLLGLFTAFLSWTDAARLFLCLQLAISWYSIRALARAAGTSPWIWLVAPGAFFLNVNFWYGFASFQTGIAFLFLFIAVLLRGSSGKRVHARLALLLVLLFFTHMVPFTFACLVIVCGALSQKKPRLLLHLLPTACLLLVYTVLRFADGNVDATAVQVKPFAGGAAFFLYKLNTVLKSFGLINPGDLQFHSLAILQPGVDWFIFCLLANTVLCTALLWIVVKSARRGMELDPWCRAVWITVLLSLPAYFLLPTAMLGISDPGSRVFQTSLYLAVFLSRRPVAAWLSAAAASLVLTATGFFLFVKLSYQTPPPAPYVRLPLHADRLALVRYAIFNQHYRDLAAGEFRDSVFPTGIFYNVPPPDEPPK